MRIVTITRDSWLCIDALKAPKERIPWKLVNFVFKALQSVCPFDYVVLTRVIRAAKMACP